MVNEKKLHGYGYLYNLGEKSEWNESSMDNLSEIDFYKVMKVHFGEMKENGNHKNIVRKNYKIYFGWWGKLESGIEFYYSGKESLVELMKLSVEQNWAVTIPYQKRLINLLSLEKEGFENLDELLIVKAKQNIDSNS